MDANLNVHGCDKTPVIFDLCHVRFDKREQKSIHQKEDNRNLFLLELVVTFSGET